MIRLSRRTILTLTIALGGSAAPSLADSRFLMVTDRFGGRVMLFSAADGTLVNPTYIDYFATGAPLLYPVEPIQVGDEIWISDILIGLQRFSLDGSTYLGVIGQGILSQTGGFEVVNGIAYVPIGSGPQSGTVVMLDRSSNLVGSFVVGGTNSDILRRGDELLIQHHDASGGSILRYSLAGAPLGAFTCAGCPAPDIGRQLALHPDGGVLAADSFVGAIYRYSASGQFVALHQPLGNLWGIHMLDNGRVMCAQRKGNGSIFAYDLAAGSSTVFASNRDAFGIGLLVLPSPCYANCDGSATPPVLNVLDFGCFLNRFAAGDTYANCDGSTTGPTLNVLDFSCFLNSFAAGCS